MGLTEKAPSTVLKQHRADILAQWESQVRELRAARGLNHYELLDHLPALLDRIGEMADQLCGGAPADLPPQEARAHAVERLQVGFDLAQLIQEYGILRRSVATFSQGDPACASALDEAIDRALVISAERFAEAHTRALRESRNSVRRLEGILSAIFDGVLVTDRTGRVVLANEGAARVFGVPRDSLCVPLSELAARFDLRSPEGEPVPPIAARALTGDTVEPVERLITHPVEHAGRHVRASAGPLLGDDGTVEGAVVIVSDITDRKKIETDLVDAARLREEILAVVSHDLRNPLGAIRMSADHLVRKTTDPRARKQIETIRRSAVRMDRLMGDLLDVASLQVGRLPVEPQPIDLHPLVDEALEAHQALAQDKALHLRRDPPLHDSAPRDSAPVDSAPRDSAPVDIARRPPSLLPRAMADRGRTFQVLSNLLGNAIKFCSPGDTISVHTAVEHGALHLSVSDTGPGIPEADLPHIFQPYWSKRNPAKQGTGLGLFISKGIVEAQGGHLWVDSHVGAGTTFHFTVPLASERSSGLPDSLEPRPAEQPATPPNPTPEDDAEPSEPEPP